MVSGMEAPGPLRAVRSWEELAPDRGEDDAVLEAMLLTAGEKGYAKATVREVAARAGVGEDRVHRRLGGKEECFARAYEQAAGRLAERVAAACEEAGSWRGAFRAGLAELLRSVAAQPLQARALLIEVRAARGRAWEVHQELVGRAVAALETASAQPGARAEASPMTAGFIAGAIEESIAIELAGDRAARIERLLGDLTHLAFLQLFGEE